MKTQAYIRRISLHLLIILFGLFLNSCEKQKQTPPWNTNSSSSNNSETLIPANSIAHNELASQEKSEPTISSITSGDKNNTVFMYYNIRNYLTMRRGDTERSKPESEIIALINNIKRVNPHILGVCEIGDEKDLQNFSNRLKSAGLHLPNSYLTMGSDPTRRQAILSKYPITPHSVPKYTYRMDGREFEVKRGILDASIETPQGTFRFVGVHLKSKRPSKNYDQSLVRRNEALILREHASSLLQSGVEKLIVYGDMNDTKNSSPLRAIKGPYRGNLSLKPIDLEANDGSRWTQYWGYQDVYSRFDFALINESMKPHIDNDESYILSIPKDDPASDHRALIISIK